MSNIAKIVGMLLPINHQQLDQNGRKIQHELLCDYNAAIRVYIKFENDATNLYFLKLHFI